VNEIKSTSVCLSRQKASSQWSNYWSGARKGRSQATKNISFWQCHCR